MSNNVIVIRIRIPDEYIYQQIWEFLKNTPRSKNYQQLLPENESVGPFCVAFSFVGNRFQNEPSRKRIFVGSKEKENHITLVLPRKHFCGQAWLRLYRHLEKKNPNVNPEKLTDGTFRWGLIIALYEYARIHLSSRAQTLFSQLRDVSAETIH